MSIRRHTKSEMKGIGLKFDFIKWEDTEPWSIEDLLKLEVEE